MNTLLVILNKMQSIILFANVVLCSNFENEQPELFNDPSPLLTIPENNPIDILETLTYDDF